MKEVTCILIDDHTLFNDGLKMILQLSSQYKVLEQVYDSRQAYHKCFSLSPDLILVDYNMPYLNGIEVVKQLNSLTFKPKIVVLSMYSEKKDVLHFKEIGVNGYLTKTTPSNELVLRLNEIMSGKNYFELKNPDIGENKDFFSIHNLLTKREIDILKLVKKEFTSEQIAQTLNLSHFTVDTHRKNIHQKLKFDSKKEYYDFLEGL